MLFFRVEGIGKVWEIVSWRGIFWASIPEKILQIPGGIKRFLRNYKILQIRRENWAILEKLQDSANSQPKFYSPQKKQKINPKKSYNLTPRLPNVIFTHFLSENFQKLHSA